MTDTPDHGIRTEVRESLVLTYERIDQLGNSLGFDAKQITVVHTYCQWVARGLEVQAISLEDLVTVLDNRLLRRWIRRCYPDPYHIRFEATCDAFVIFASCVVDEIIAGHPV